MKITQKMKDEFMEARRNKESAGQLQQQKGGLLLRGMLDKYGKDGLEKIARALDKEREKVPAPPKEKELKTLKDIELKEVVGGELWVMKPELRQEVIKWIKASKELLKQRPSREDIIGWCEDNFPEEYYNTIEPIATSRIIDMLLHMEYLYSMFFNITDEDLK